MIKSAVETMEIGLTDGAGLPTLSVGAPLFVMCLCLHSRKKCVLFIDIVDTTL